MLPPDSGCDIRCSGRRGAIRERVGAGTMADGQLVVGFGAPVVWLLGAGEEGDRVRASDRQGRPRAQWFGCKRR